MTKEEVLQKSIRKAIINGWKPDYMDGYNHPACIIFSHDFAKYFWGNTVITPLSVTFKDNEIRNNEVVTIAGTIWQYHLQQMVLQADPLKYLEKFL